MAIGSIEPPQWDEEIFGRRPDNLFSEEPNIDSDEGDSCSRGSLSEYSENEEGDECGSHTLSSSRQGKPRDHWLILGLSKGGIVFVRVDEMARIYARFSLHKQAVEHVYEIKS